eukprot:Gregarina_sp_Poly_1__6690@NODE_35_length_18769_cov_73_980644_g30_i0_p1_GENE_NODE_35_length_18769_cov_73_980644_g30_i0NODE_35_length_18769_cov_73_980644_g30_i0_p1_ORF_typecomplete_len773_score100_48Ribonuclease_3/PF00636_26/8_9e17Ribonucleas_3_3/PF14622_6/9_1e10_NODE_35_length_18769_cov_73_980644_g30_i01441216730
MLHCEGILRPLPRALERPSDRKYSIYHVYYCVNTWNSEILRSGGHFGRWRRYYSPDGHLPSLVASLLNETAPFRILHDLGDDQDEDEEISKFQRLSNLESKFQELKKGKQCLMELLERSVALAQAASAFEKGSPEHPFQVLQPLSILIKGYIEVPLQSYFVHWATHETVKVELRPVSSITLTEEEVGSLQSFQQLLFQFWKIFSLEPIDDDLELVPSHFLLAPLDSSTNLIDSEYVQSILKHQAYLQLGNRRLAQSFDSTPFSFSRMRANLESTFESFCASHCGPEAPAANRNQTILDPAKAEFCPVDLMTLLDHRGAESVVVRLCHRHMGEFNFFRVDDVAWDVPAFLATVESGETLQQYYENKFDVTSDEKSIYEGIIYVSKLRQGPRVGLTEGDYYTRHEIIHSAEICILTLLTEPIIQQLSWVPSIIYSLEKIAGFIEVMQPLSDTAKAEPSDYSLERGPNGRMRLNNFSNDPIVTFKFDILRKAFLVPSATQGDVETAVLSKRVLACRVKENAATIHKALASVIGQENIVPLESDTDDSIIDFLRAHDPDHLGASSLPYRYTHSQVLEFHGDAILKYLSAVYVFFRYPTASEGYLSQQGDQFKSNAALRAVATKTKLRNQIISKCVNLKSHGKGPRGTLLALRDQTISWKQQADVVEALLGALYWSQCDRLELWPCLGIQCVTSQLLNGSVDSLARASLWPLVMSSDFIGNPNALFICAKFMDTLFNPETVSFCQIFSQLRNSVSSLLVPPQKMVLRSMILNCTRNC